MITIKITPPSTQRRLVLKCLIFKQQWTAETSTAFLELWNDFGADWSWIFVCLKLCHFNCSIPLKFSFILNTIEKRSGIGEDRTDTGLGWQTGRQSAMKDVAAAAVIFSYQFSGAIIRNISLKIRRKKKDWRSIEPFQSLELKRKNALSPTV